MERELNDRQRKLNTIIFGTETPEGRRYDEWLIFMIITSVLIVVVDSIQWVNINYHTQLYALEWFFTLIFTVDYGLRLYCAKAPTRYARSFYGVVDLISIIPTYFALFYSGAQYLLVVRILRVLRIFRVMKLIKYLSEANILMRSLIQSRRKILIFFATVLMITTIFGALMYLIEGPDNGFTSIPRAIYWAIITVTTVGYGDITPQTALGQGVAALAMMMGYSVIAVPTGILTAELTSEIYRDRVNRKCGSCSRFGHDADAIHCKFCGKSL